MTPRNLQGPYTPGVPTPFVAHTHPYPTRFHGGVWTRPVFGMPEMAQSFSVFIPGRDISMQGLGDAEAGESLQYNTGRGIFKPGGHGGGVFDGNISGLGADATDAVVAAQTLAIAAKAQADVTNYPWGQYSDKTKALQTSTNQSLAKAGYCPIAADGKLGPSTCGARNRLSLDAAARGEGTFYDIPATCADYKTPRKTSAGCGTGGGAPVLAPATPGSSASVNFDAPGMTDGTKKALAFLVGGLGAIGVVYYMKKRKR